MLKLLSYLGSTEGHNLKNTIFEIPIIPLTLKHKQLENHKCKVDQPGYY